MMVEKHRGFTLIEVLVATASLFLFLAGVGAIVDTSLRVMGTARAKHVAATLAQRRIEEAHNMSYEDVGTVGGIPPGLMQQQEVVTVGSLNYKVLVSVYYVDDPFDGEAPVDTLPVDYKRVKVAVTWDGSYQSHTPLELWTDVSPKGVETLEGAGTLSIMVFDSEAEPVIGADVSILNDQVVPGVNLNTLSDSQGRVLLPGALACVDCYKISVSKDGYTSDRTYGTDEVDIPAKPHLTVIEGEVSEVSFAIDVTSTIHYKTVRTEEYNYAPISAVQLHSFGTKQIGTTALLEPVYAYDEMVVTQSPNGEVYVSGMAWDQYTVEVPMGSSVEEAGTSPLAPFVLDPGQQVTFYMVVAPSSNDSLLVTLTNELSAPVASGSVELTHLTLPWIATKSTGLSGTPNKGQAYFPGLDPADYVVRGWSLGYEEATASVAVSGDVFETYQLVEE